MLQNVDLIAAGERLPAGLQWGNGVAFEVRWGE
jgi:hypothetical protein